MDKSTRPSWTDAELAGLLAEYFGEKLSADQVERMVRDVAAALADRRRRAEEASEAAEPGTDDAGHTRAGLRASQRGPGTAAGGSCAARPADGGGKADEEGRPMGDRR